MAVFIVDPLKVIIQPAKTETELRVRNGNLKVCAYARVSTDDEEQMTSYNSQITHYSDKIKSTKGWDFVTVYADEGITGTSTKHRSEFKKMIQHCQQGKIDLIITKSVSRFARNSLDSIQYARMLKTKGVGIIFEKENIDTRELDNEMILIVMSAFAQAESESISANVAIGKRNGFKQGRYTFPKRMYGYLVTKKNEEQVVEIVEEESAVIKMIFDYFLAGKTYIEIANRLENMNIPARNKQDKWHGEMVSRILRNEKYKGQIIMQKTYVSDLFNKTIKTNNGELPKYIINNAHPAIINEKLFNTVQAELKRRNNRSTHISVTAKTEQTKYSGKYALTKKVFCDECGSEYRRITNRKLKNGHEKITVFWKCHRRHPTVLTLQVFERNTSTKLFILPSAKN